MEFIFIVVLEHLENRHVKSLPSRFIKLDIISRIWLVKLNSCFCRKEKKGIGGPDMHKKKATVVFN